MMSVEIQKLLLDKHMSKAECTERCGWSPATSITNFIEIIFLKRSFGR